MTKQGRPKEGLFLALIFGLIVVLGTIFFFKPWLPDLASDRGEIDRLFNVILIITGIAFVLVQGITGYFVWKYSDPTPERALYLTDSKGLEITWTAITAIILIVIGWWGLGLWNRMIASAPPENVPVIEVTGQQFQWIVRYPGPQGEFGRIDPKLISDDNILGLDPKDEKSKDNVVVQDELFLQVNQQVTIRLKSKDVIHSFFLPNFRVKQDAVPGLGIQTTFTPTKVGNYEIACAQLCGLGHYKMRGIVHVLSHDDYLDKLKQLKTSATSLQVGWKGSNE